MGLKTFTSTSLCILGLSSAAVGGQSLLVEIEEVNTPAWVIEETEAAVVENRAADYSQEQVVIFRENDQPPADESGEHDEVLPILPPQEEGPETDGPSVPPMDPDGGLPGEDEPSGDKPDEDPFPPQDGDEDPFPGPDEDPFPPVDGSDPIPGFPDGEDPFPPIGDPVDGGLPGFGDPWLPDPGWGGSGPIATIDQIVNLGHKVWKIIQENQPVIRANYKYANAIPAGTSATDLEYFSPVQYKSFRIKLKNRFDTDVVDVTYTTVHRFGGRYDGKGSFLERVSIVPSKIVVGYNYQFNFSVTNVTVANVGSKDEPVASMGVDALIEYGSTFKKTSRRILFEFRGDSPDVKQYRVD